LSNIIVVAVSLLFINHIANLTSIRGTLVIPPIVLLCFIGAYTSSNSLADLIILLVFGGIGYAMVHFKWPRPPFILGFILGDLAETYLYISVARYGVDFLFRPKVLVLLVLSIVVALYPFFQKNLKKLRLPFLSKGTPPNLQS